MTLVRELEGRRGAQGLAPRLEAADVIRAGAAGDEVLDHLLPRVGGELLLDVREQVQLFGVPFGHHRFDSVRSAEVPRRSASSLRPRKMRDFTVPSATPVISAISP